jgi:hypothetical protein
LAQEAEGCCYSSRLTALIAHIIFVVPIACPAASQIGKTINLLRPAVAQNLAREGKAAKNFHQKLSAGPVNFSTGS